MAEISVKQLYRSTWTYRGANRGANAFSAGLTALSMSLSLALAMSLTFSYDANAASTYYRWKDAQGKLVVSDRPPRDESIEYEVVSQNSSLVRRVRPGEGAVPAEVNPRPGNEFEQVDTRREQLEAVNKNPESCARAKENLDTLNTAVRIRIRDSESGELRFLSEEEKETQRQKARDIIRVHCD